ncbi:hypothetical protein [Agarivorans sp. QJM3NY_25]|uniref:hypothetical protein n=1 Tax=Agarivorans sp. QJM3NY_25 TaxID=3421430 RepID=UPI003D7CD8D0
MRFVNVSFEEAAPYLAQAMGDDAKAIEAQVKNGEADCYKAGQAYFLMRVETLFNGVKELVLVAIAGRNVAELRHDLVTIAKAVGAGSIRWHTTSKLAAKERYFMRFFADLEPQLTEKVYKVRVNYGE